MAADWIILILFLIFFWVIVMVVMAAYYWRSRAEGAWLERDALQERVEALYDIIEELNQQHKGE